MEVQFYLQPFQIGGGPHRCGNHLLQLLDREDNGEFNERFILSVAFVKRTGMRHLMGPLTALRGRGGRIEAYIGTNRLGDTTREAIRAVCHVAHDVRAIRIRGRTFHPKVFVHERRTDEGGDATLLIGSNNLNSQALFRNVEEFVRIDLDLDSAEDLVWYTDFLTRIETPFTGEHHHNDRLVGRGDVEQLNLDTGVLWFLKENDQINQAEFDFILGISRNERQSSGSTGSAVGTAAPGVINPSGGLATGEQIPDAEFDMNQFSDPAPEVDEPAVDDQEVGEEDAPPPQPPAAPQMEIPQVFFNRQLADIVELLQQSEAIHSVYNEWLENTPPAETPIALFFRANTAWAGDAYGAGHRATEFNSIPPRAWTSYLPPVPNHGDLHRINIFWAFGDQTHEALQCRYTRTGNGNTRLTPSAPVINYIQADEHFVVLVPLNEGWYANALLSDNFEIVGYDVIGIVVDNEHYPQLHALMTNLGEAAHGRNYGHLRLPEGV